MGCAQSKDDNDRGSGRIENVREVDQHHRQQSRRGNSPSVASGFTSRFLGSRFLGLGGGVVGGYGGLRNLWRDDFTEIRIIGEGSVSNVYQVESKVPEEAGKVYALKQMDADLVDPESTLEMKREYQILRACTHPNIPKAYRLYEPNGEEEMCIVMELCSGGNLKYLELPLQEQDTKHIVRQLLSALQYLHDNKGIAYRDMTLEHILFVNDQEDNYDIKLCDFGLSKRIRRGEKFSKMVGDPSYLSPENLRTFTTTQSSGNGGGGGGGDLPLLCGCCCGGSGYTQQADLWSVGVITYQLLSGDLPFRGNDMDDVTNRVIRCDYNFDSPIWSDRRSTVSKESQLFIRRLLQEDPHQRYTAREALNDPWIASVAAPVDEESVTDPR